MAVKLLAFDLDGTTITEHKYLSRENREALIKAGKQGVVLVPATGRMKAFLPSAVTELPGVRYAITCNGASVYDLQLDTPVYQKLIPNEKAKQVQKVLEDYDIYVEYYSHGEATTRQGYPELSKTHFGFPPSKWHFVDGKKYSLCGDFLKMLEDTGMCPEKINLPYLKESVRQELWGRLAALGGLKLTSSIPDNIEINDAKADKGGGVQALARRLKIGREEIMAIGDNGNDITMLKCAGYSVAVADGSQEALAAARYVTAAPHWQNALAEAIGRFLA